MSLLVCAKDLQSHLWSKASLVNKYISRVAASHATCEIYLFTCDAFDHSFLCKSTVHTSNGSLLGCSRWFNVHLLLEFLFNKNKFRNIFERTKTILKVSRMCEVAWFRSELFRILNVKLWDKLEDGIAIRGFFYVSQSSVRLIEVVLG